MSILERTRWQLHPFLAGRVHGRRIIMTGGALCARDRLHTGGAAVLLVTRGTRAVLDNIWFVKVVNAPALPEVAVVAFFINHLDPVGGDAVAKTFLEDLLELFRA